MIQFDQASVYVILKRLLESLPEKDVYFIYELLTAPYKIKKNKQQDESDTRQPTNDNRHTLLR